MSHIGAQPITIPEGITVTLTPRQVTAKGAKGELSFSLPNQIKVVQKDNQLLVSTSSKARPVQALYGLTRNLINNFMIGLTQGFTKTLEIQGTGYRVNPKDKGLELSLGFSHPIIFNPPEGIKLEIKENKFIVVSGVDKQLVGQVAANLRRLREPDAYKGKGIRYLGEYIKLKPGKAAKAAES